MAEAGDTSEKLERRDAVELENFANQHTVAEVYAEIKRRLDAWEKIELNVGIIGATGVGKSTFINTLRREKPTDPGAAPTGVGQTYMRPTLYEHPRNLSIKLWDIPGVGTAECPKEGYLKQIEFDKYDFFLLMCCARFTENSLWLAHTIRQADKRFYFIRSKVDIDVRSDREDNPDTHSEESVLRQLKNDCSEELSKAGFTDPNVFLVCKNAQLYDFPALEEKLITDLPELKQEAALLTMRRALRKIIKDRTVRLHRRSWLLALGSGLVGLIPVPGLTLIINTVLIIRVINIYKQVYGLDKGGLKQLCETSHVPEKEAAEVINENFWLNLTQSTWLKSVVAPFAAVSIREIIQFALSVVVGVTSGGALSFAVTKLFLHTTIASMERAALTVMDLAFSRITFR